MKRFLLPALALLLVASCNTPREWHEQQRAEFLTSLDDYRQMIYLNEFSDPEFVIFTTDLSGEIETSYPVYTEFIAMPALSDTIDMWVVETIVDQLNADAQNMRYLYPYRTLVAQGILPMGLSHQERMSFYKCQSLVGRLNDTCHTTYTYLSHHKPPYTPLDEPMCEPYES